MRLFQTLRRTAASVALLTACSTSPAPGNYAPARQPYGVDGTLAMRNGQSHVGELLAIDDTAFVIHTGGRVGVARFADVQFAAFQGVSTNSGKRPSDKVLADMRLFARFPFGIPVAAMTALLAKSAQNAPDDLARAAR